MENDLSKEMSRRRKVGHRFEIDVRDDLISKGWLVFKNNNKVQNNRFVQAPHFFSPYKKMMTQGQGFPDFICVKAKERFVMFVESKKCKYLKPEEKEAVKWIKENLDIPIQIAFKNKQGGLQYVDT